MPTNDQQTMYRRIVGPYCYAVLLWLFCSLYSVASTAQDVALSELVHGNDISAYFQIIEDSADNMGFEQLAQSNSHVNSPFREQGSTINLGFTTSPYWFYLPVNNDTSETQSLLIEVAYPLLDNITLYVKNVSEGANGGLTKVSTGDHFPFNQRPVTHPHFVFPVTFEANNQYQVAFFIETSSSLQVPIKFWNSAQFYEKTQPELIRLGVIIGIGAIMALYNFFIFLSIREKSYLYFVVTLVLYMTLSGVLTGLTYAYVWPNSIWWNDKSLLIVGSLCLAALTQFAYHFLSIEKVLPVVKPYFTYLTYIALAATACTLFVGYSSMIKIVAALFAFIPIFLYINGIILCRKGHKSAQLFTIIFTLFILSSVIFTLSKYGIIERSAWTEYSIYFSSTLVISLLSFALTDRIHRERKEREAAQESSIENLREYRQLYENSIEGFFRSKITGEPISVNPAFASIFGYSTTQDYMNNELSIWDKVSNLDNARENLIQDLISSGRTINYEFNGYKQDRTQFWGRISAKISQTDTGESVIDGSIEDITERKVSENQLNYLACHDSLTGLTNRGEFEKRVNKAIENCRKKNSEYALFYMDLDQFKVVNDTCGHSAGDELLRQISILLRKHLRQRDTLARLGGDEFAVLLDHCDIEDAEKVGQTLREAINSFRFTWEHKNFSVGISIGVVSINARTESSKQILSLADTACYAAKDAGRNRIYVHNEEADCLQQRQNEMQLVSTIGDAINNNDMRLYKQNIISTDPQKQNNYYEILVRLTLDGNLAAPGTFLPAAERYNLMPMVDTWVVKTFFAWLAENHEERESLHIANINLSAQSIGNTDFADEVYDLFTQYDIPPNKICFEITESVAISNLSDTLTFINRLKAMGVKFALDDFGSGYSSFSYLKSLPVDVIKIDGHFVQGILSDDINLTMIRSMTEICHSLNMLVVAEYVENENIYKKLKEIGVDYMQGHWFSEPEPLKEITALKAASL